MQPRKEIHLPPPGNIKNNTPPLEPDQTRQQQEEHLRWVLATATKDAQFNTPERVEQLKRSWEEMGRVAQPKFKPGTFIPEALKPQQATKPAPQQEAFPIPVDPPPPDDSSNGDIPEPNNRTLPMRGTIFTNHAGNAIGSNNATGDSGTAAASPDKTGDEPTFKFPENPNLFGDASEIKALLDGIGRVPEVQKRPLPPTLAEKVFFCGFFPSLQIEDQHTNTQRKTIEKIAKDSKTRTLVRQLLSTWTDEIREFPDTGRLALAFQNNVYPTLFLEDFDEQQIFAQERYFAPFLLGKMLAQRALGRIPFTNLEEANKFLEIFKGFYELNLGKIERSTSATNAGKVNYYTIVFDPKIILGILQERPAIQSLRFSEAIFPPIEQPVTVETS